VVICVDRGAVFPVGTPPSRPTFSTRLSWMRRTSLPGHLLRRLRDDPLAVSPASSHAGSLRAIPCIAKVHPHN
jgi:hypothetical protein